MSNTTKTTAKTQDGTSKTRKASSKTKTRSKTKNPKKSKEKAPVKITEYQTQTLKLAATSPFGSTTYKEVQNSLSLKKSHVCRFIKMSSGSLLEKGLVEIYLQEPDERSIHPYYAIYITPEGKTLLKSILNK